MSKGPSKTASISSISNEAGAAKRGQRVDQFLALNEDLPSRSQLKIWFEEGRIRLQSGQILKPSSKIFPGDQILIDRPKEPRSHKLEARPLDLEIFFEDENLIVLFKPRGLSMHPGANRDDPTTLVHGLLAHSKNLSSRSGEFRPGIVHRLDKDTEGIVVVAKNDQVHDFLAKQFASRTIDRNYWALCYGKVPPQLVIEGNIGRHPSQRKKMTVLHRGGKPAKTEVKGLRFFEEGYSWVDCKLYSGRTHQIRVHLSSKKFPLLNDPVYGSGNRKLKNLSPKKNTALEKLKGQALVAYRLGFIHPKTQEKMNFEVDYPRWLRIFLEE